MAHEFDDLIADLDAAKAGVERSVKKSRAFIADHRAAQDARSRQGVDKRLFDWSDREG